MHSNCSQKFKVSTTRIGTDVFVDSTLKRKNKKQIFNKTFSSNFDYILFLFYQYGIPADLCML